MLRWRPSQLTVSKNICFSMPPVDWPVPADISKGVAGLGHAYAVSGRRGAALKILDELTNLSKQSYFSPYTAFVNLV